MPLSGFTQLSAPVCWNPYTMLSWRMSWPAEGYAQSGSSRFRSSMTNVRIDTGFRADLIVEDKVIVEVKSVDILAPLHKKQLLTYLRLADKRLGLLINFHVALIKDGITRIVNGLEDDTHAKPPSRKAHERHEPVLPGISRA